jgi:hypothetical protein
MNSFLTIAAATLIAGAATVASAMDHKGSKKHVPEPTAPAKSESTVTAHRASVHKRAHARHHNRKHKRHHSAHHAKK